MNREPACRLSRQAATRPRVALSNLSKTNGSDSRDTKFSARSRRITNTTARPDVAGAENMTVDIVRTRDI